MTLVRRLRYEVASRLNRLAAQRDYRWTSSRKGDRISFLIAGENIVSIANARPA